MHSCLYTGHVLHQRIAPKPHGFKQAIYMTFLDLDEIEQVFSKSRFWSIQKWNLLSFYRQDYFAKGTTSLKNSLQQYLLKKTGETFDGPIRMLTHLRSFGYVMNPVTFYYCYRNSDKQPRAIVAEINNTPWDERFSYLIYPYKESQVTTFTKDFHVSPFMSMDQTYHWRFSVPGKQLLVHMENQEHQQKIFHAELKLQREELTPKSMFTVLLRYPFMTLKVLFMIYFHAALLKMKGIPFYSHPKSK